jgi:murein DD-endopeptidase MepM/ murein hydrolase activator NlpD
MLLLTVLSLAGTAGAAPARSSLSAGVSPTDPLPAPGQLAPGARYFAESGHTLQGGFREYWEAHRGADVLGLPLSEEFAERYTDGSTQTVQYFERGVLEYHPAAASGQQVMPRDVGALLLHGRHFTPPASGEGQRFPATGFTVGGEFLRFWRDLDGATVFGNPLSPAVLEDGRTVQYFERARFEYHPEFTGPAYDVALAPAGYEALRTVGYSLPLGVLVQVEPPTVAEGHTLLVRAALPKGGKVTGKLDNQPLTFVRAGANSEEGHAVAGVQALGAIGPHRLTLTLTDARGRSRVVTRTVQVKAWSFPTERLELDDETSELLDPAIVDRELRQINEIFAGRSPRALWSGPFRLPLAGSPVVTAPFGQRRAYNNGPVSTFHGGTDFRAAAGSSVLAAAGGRVVLATRLQVRGNAIIIDHGLGVFSMYAHLSSFKVKKGDTVKSGQVIGPSGNTGLSTGPHLHWELHVSGPAVDPFEWTRRAFP